MQAETVSAEVPDWSREAVGLFEFNPGRKLLKSIRDWQRHKARGGLAGKALAWLASKRHMVWSVVSGADIPLKTQIGGGLLIPHPNGIVIHPDSVIGVNCLLFQQVTLGTNSSSPPVLGGHVDIGAGAKVLGKVRIGNHARIGANAVVTKEVPEGATMVGIPAKPVPVAVKPETQSFVPYGTPCSERFDPATQKLELLQCEMQVLQKRLAELLEERDAAAAKASAKGKKSA